MARITMHERGIARLVHQWRTGLRKASLMHALVCATKSADRCVTERIGARTCLQNRVCSPPPALLCALARHLGQFDRVVGVLEGAQAVRRHPQAALLNTIHSTG